MHSPGVLTIGSSCTLKLVFTSTGNPVSRLRMSWQSGLSARSRRLVDVDHGRDAIAPFRAHVAGDRHVAAGAPIDVCHVENLCGFLALDNRRERHELGTFQPGDEQIMRFAARRICENCARAQSARTEFHAVRVDRADCDDVGTKAAIALEGIDVQKDADVGGLMPEKLRHQLAPWPPAQISAVLLAQPFHAMQMTAGNMLRL